MLSSQKTVSCRDHSFLSRGHLIDDISYPRADLPEAAAGCYALDDDTYAERRGAKRPIRDMTTYNSTALRKLTPEEQQRALERIERAQSAARRREAAQDASFLANCKAWVTEGEILLLDLIQLQEVFERYKV